MDSPPIITGIIAEHAAEAGFLWNRRRHLRDDPAATCAALAQLDERIDLHLDGVRLAGASGQALARDAFAATPQPPEAFALLAAALRGEAAAPAAALAALAAHAGNDAVWAAAADATAWAPWPRVAPLVEHAARGDRRQRRLALIAVTHHRIADHPLLIDTDPDLAALRAQAVLACGRVDLAPTLRPLLGADDMPTRRHAARALLLLSSDADAHRLLVGCATSALDGNHDAADLIARCGDARTWVLAGDAPLPIRITAAAACGDPALLPWLVERLAEPALAPAAAQAIARITGIPVSDAPDRDALRRQVAALALPAGTRHLAGAPITREHLLAVWRHGAQADRRAAALEFIRLEPGPLGDHHAPRCRFTPC